jgi:hypothetical protein
LKPTADTTNFSIDGYNAIVDYFEEIGKNIELDVIGICCNFKELTPDNLMYDYSTYGKDIEEIAEKLSYETWIIELKKRKLFITNFLKKKDRKMETPENKNYIEKKNGEQIEIFIKMKTTKLVPIKEKIRQTREKKENKKKIRSKKKWKQKDLNYI